MDHNYQTRTMAMNTKELEAAVLDLQRYAGTVETERDRLRALNADMLAALNLGIEITAWSLDSHDLVAKRDNAAGCDCQACRNNRNFMRQARAIIAKVKGG